MYLCKICFKTLDQKQQWIDASTELKQLSSEDANFFCRIVTGNENWIYEYDNETKQQLSRWSIQVHQHWRNAGKWKDTSSEFLLFCLTKTLPNDYEDTDNSVT